MASPSDLWRSVPTSTYSWTTFLGASPPSMRCVMICRVFPSSPSTFPASVRDSLPEDTASWTGLIEENRTTTSTTLRSTYHFKPQKDETNCDRLQRGTKRLESLESHYFQGLSSSSARIAGTDSHGGSHRFESRAAHFPQVPPNALVSVAAHDRQCGFFFRRKPVHTVFLPTRRSAMPKFTAGRVPSTASTRPAGASGPMPAASATVSRSAPASARGPGGAPRQGPAATARR
jgi:hypothetical protein